SSTRNVAQLCFDFDSTLLTSEEPTDKNIVEYITANKQRVSDEEEKFKKESLPTAEEALKAAYS
ncbi:hypothetical protein M0802_014144, partial [Mischocyttarus mexicanus]